MSDNEPSAPETSEQEATEETTEQQTQKPTETVDFWKAKAREQEKRAKDNADAARRLADIEQANKTEAEKAADELKQLTVRAETAEVGLLRYEVAAEKGVPAKALRLLTGSTREEVEASAADVLELIGDAGKPRTPKPSPAQREGYYSTAEDKDAVARAFFGISS